MRKLTVKDLVFCALFAALTAVSAQLAIPIGPVPISLCTLAVMLCGMLLGVKGGGIAIGCYILLGLAGIPVFAGFKGGASALAGPTGGYIVGYLPYAMLCGLAAKEGAAFGRRCLAALGGTAACYLLGAAWFMLSTGSTLAGCLSACILPFLPGDALKILLSAALSPRLRKALNAIR